MKGKKLILEDFLKRSIIIHNDKYIYTKTILGANNKQKVIIICPIHGQFLQTPDNHLSGRGCKKCAGVKLKKTHGLRFHPLYSRWDGMMQRCYNPRSTSYKNYGGRGIIVSETLKDCKTYIDYITTLENYNTTLKLEIDRIDNDGNYEEGNLRWATVQEQSYNKRTSIDNKSGYTGVAPAVNSPKWRSYLFTNNHQIMIGIFNTIKEAVEARNSYIKENNLPHKLQKFVENEL